jgi:hypothetical protein
MGSTTSTTSTSTSSTSTSTTSTSHPISTMTTSELLAYALKLEETVLKQQAAASHLELCIALQISTTFALNEFQSLYSRSVINSNSALILQENELIAAKTKSWFDRFAAYKAANPASIEDVLWIIAKMGHTKVAAPLMNLSKATRYCKYLQRTMREVKNEKGQTQLWFYCNNRMTKSVERMLSMRNIDIESDSEWASRDGVTCLHIAVVSRRIDICKLLIEKEANLEANDSEGFTPLLFAIMSCEVDMIQFLCDLGANIDVRDKFGRTPLYIAVSEGSLPIAKELIERKADVNARDYFGKSALGLAIRYKKGPEMINYLISIGGIE